MEILIFRVRLILWGEESCTDRSVGATESRCVREKYFGGWTCKPDFVRQNKFAVAIIPLGPGSRRDSSSLPEG